MARLTEVAVASLTTPLHTPFVTALRQTTALTSVIVRVTDDEGCVGFGEAPQVWRVTGESIGGIRDCVLGPLAQELLGRSTGEPLDLASDALQQAVVGNYGAKAACEVAVADLSARKVGQSLGQTLQAPVDELPTDITIAADQGPDVVRRHVAEGFTHLKVKVGLDDDAARVRRIRDVAPEHVRIRIDANQGWDFETALATLDDWDRWGVGIEFLEQPLPRWDLDGHAQLRRETAVPIMLDESVFDKWDLFRVIDLDAADLINIKLAKCGGLVNGTRLAHIASEAGLGVMVGSMMESSIGVSAAAALAASVSPLMVHDLDTAWWTVDAETSGRYRGNVFVLPPGSGLSSVTDLLPHLDWSTRV